MSFTIKCDKCGHTAKFVKSKRRHNETKRAIKIYKDNDYILVLLCSVCGYKEKEI